MKVRLLLKFTVIFGVIIMQFVIVTGLSGSGKSCAMNILEDMGFYCIDNMPPQLISKFIKLCVDGKMDKIAIAVDIRSGDMFTEEVMASLEKMKTEHFNFKILYLEASNDVLIKRYKETRRKHPLDSEFGGSIPDAIKYERNKLNCLREIANYYIDTSYLKSTQLRETIINIFNPETSEIMLIKSVSFGFKYGSNAEADLVFDVRCLPNPFYIPELKHLTGENPEVREYVMNSEDSVKLLEKIEDLLEFLIPKYIKEGKNQLVIAFGCTGGKHRSVTFAELTGDFLTEKGYNVLKIHRDISKN